MNAAGWKRFAAEYARSTSSVIAAAVLVVLVLAALFAPVLAPQDPYDLAQLEPLDARLAPGSASSPASSPGTSAGASMLR